MAQLPRLATKNVRTADPSSDGRRSAAIFATVELPSAAGGGNRLAAPGTIHLVPPTTTVASLLHRASTEYPIHIARCDALKSKGSLYSITERMVPELIPVLGSQPAGDVSHKPGGRLPLLSARPAVNPATLKRAATNFAAW